MAKGKGKTDRAAWEVDFVAVNLPRESIEQCKAWDVGYVQTMKTVDNALFKACKVSLSYNVTTSSYIASCTVPSPETGVQKKCFTSHAPDMMDALKIMAYKIVEGLDNDPYNIFTVSGSQEDWG